MNRLIFLTAVALVGCSTHPVALDKAAAVPADQVFAFQSPDIAASGKLVIARDAGYMASGCPMAFYVDGKLAAHLRAGETTTLTVPAGNRILSAGPAGKGMCTWGNEQAHRRETSYAVEAGTTAKIRLAITHEGVIQVTPTAF